jgi:transposase InsO family protein
MRFPFIAAEKATYPVRVLCRVLQVARSGFYAWLRRRPSRRAQANEGLQVAIRAAHRQSRETYGSPRVQRELVAQGFETGRHRVARQMRTMGLIGRRPKRFRLTTDSSHDRPVAANVLQREFSVEGTNQAWVTDITYLWTREGWLYLAVVLDLFARRVVGWAMAEHLRTSLALDALHMALGRRLPEPGLVHHSDRSCQYASDAYRAVLARRGILCSMSRKANCWDNAVAESFFSTLKIELVHRCTWPDRATARLAVAEYIECFYNAERRHSTLGYRSPAEYERIHAVRSMTAA